MGETRRLGLKSAACLDPRCMARVLRHRLYPRTELIRVVQPWRLLQTTQLSASIPRHLLLRNGHPRFSSSIIGSIREQTTARKLQIKLLRRVLASPPACPSCSSSFSPSSRSRRSSMTSVDQADHTGEMQIKHDKLFLKL
ncbi:hypothetical protein HID58_025601 [Brassica napus]|uniref:Uncharacterized protein n=1 Tax=Brassica napus TaxID=3708 RepID=A0ABQ8CLN9_BRANA|nr:hypothetical protein HID58_025601 [Brassica napus]